MRTISLAAALALVALAVSGCLGGGGAADDSGQDGSGDQGMADNATKVRSTIRVVPPAPATDTRFGEDRDLTFEDLTSLLPQDELTDYNTTKDYLLTMVGKPGFQLLEAGTTIEGRFIFGVLVNDDGVFHPERPTVMMTCSQHGNEPSGSEACLIMIEYLVHGVDQYAKDLRNELNIVFLPLSNPDGKEGKQRTNHDQIDINRDHMDMVTLEGQAIHAFYNKYDPEVVLDLHEFGGRGEQHPLYPDVPVSTYDYFEVAAPQTFYNNDAIMLQANYELEALVMGTMWETYGIGSSSHYVSQNFVSSIQRNHYGMHNSLSLLFETGGGYDTINIDLRTELHLVATWTVIDWVLADAQRVLDLEHDADESAKSTHPGIIGWVVPNQTESAKLEGFLDIHNISYTVLEADASYMVSHYETGADSAPQEISFAAGSILVDRFQADGRVGYEIFEAQHDNNYDHGPRNWGLDVWRIVSG
jgi:hypothetical protein